MGANDIDDRVGREPSLIQSAGRALVALVSTVASIALVSISTIQAIPRYDLVVERPARWRILLAIAGVQVASLAVWSVFGRRRPKPSPRTRLMSILLWAALLGTSVVITLFMTSAYMFYRWAGRPALMSEALALGALVLSVAPPHIEPGASRTRTPMVWALATMALGFVIMNANGFDFALFAVFGISYPMAAILVGALAAVGAFALAAAVAPDDRHPARLRRAGAVGGVALLTILILLTEPLRGSPPNWAVEKASQSALRNGIFAAETYEADSGTFSGFSPSIAAQIEPALTWTDSGPRPDEVRIVRADDTVVILTTQTDYSQPFCIVGLVTPEGEIAVTYGRVLADQPSECADDSWYM